MALRGRRSRNKNPKAKLEVRNPNSRNSNRRNSNRGYSNGKNLKVRDPKKMILMVIILIAFVCGLILGLSFILGGFDSSGPGEVKYENVTNNITKYENDSDMLETENGTFISYSEFDDNATEGQNITAFNASSSTNLY